MSTAVPAPTEVALDTEEVRLATTMTGGVSLAVWMGGVAREIDLVMQASRTRQARQHQETSAGTPPADQPSDAGPGERNRYAGLLKLLNIVVEVDILSGTSAGGINAVLLAYVRARNGDLSQLRDIWLELGTLLELLRDPTDSDVPSLLYGDQKMLKDLNEKLPDLAPRETSGELPSTTLYVTTTLLTGESSRFTDAMGTLVQDTSQRGLFTFTETDLVEDGIAAALALAARSTASFPGAFEPSFLPFEKDTELDGEIPARPAMKKYANVTRNHWAVDGGLLDNQPLDVLLERVFDRPAHRPVRRVLLYVVPSPGPSPDLVAAAPSANLAEPYSLLGAVLKDLTAATSQSISASLRAIVTHNDRISARTALRVQLSALGSRLAPARLLTPSLLEDYRARESERQARKLVTAMLRLLSTWSPEPSPTSPGIPKNWRAALKPGGDAEQTCREKISATLAKGWPRAVGPDGKPSQDALPDTSELFARFGHSAYDNGKSIALEVFRLGYAAAATAPDRAELAKLVEKIHSAAKPVTRPRPAVLAETICGAAIPSSGEPSSLMDTAKALAESWAEKTTVGSQAWSNLGAALHGAASRLAQVAQGAPESTLWSYVRYLGLNDDATTAATVWTRLFDLALAEQALLPAGAGPYQPVELVQLSADTRSLLAPGNSTAASKLTGLQFHHFGAFYKKSWHANDWMWGRLDAAGWLVYTLLDPRRLQVVAAHQPAGGRVDWLLDELGDLGPVPLRDGGPATSNGVPTREDLRSELAFLDKAEEPVPRGLPRTSLWVATAWQRAIAAEELPNLAQVIIGEPGKEADSSPSGTRTWASQVLAAGGDLDALLTLLSRCPVPEETFKTDMGSPLMARTITKAAATTTAAVSSIRQLPRPLRPAVTTAHTITLAGYRIANTVQPVPRALIFIGSVLLALGIAGATQSSEVFGMAGLGVAALGGYLVTVATWQLSARLLAALVGVTLTGAVALLAAPIVRRGLFGTSDLDTGYLGRRVRWLATAWWHPLLAVGVLVLLIVLVGAAFSRAKPARRRAAGS